MRITYLDDALSAFVCHQKTRAVQTDKSSQMFPLLEHKVKEPTEIETEKNMCFLVSSC